MLSVVPFWSGMRVMQATVAPELAQLEAKADGRWAHKVPRSCHWCPSGVACVSLQATVEPELAQLEAKALGSSSVMSLTVTGDCTQLVTMEDLAAITLPKWAAVWKVRDLQSV